MNKFFISILSLIFTLSGCSQTDSAKFVKKDSGELDMNKKYETATFGAGCYWCVEAVFQSLKGVAKVESGFSGGTLKSPSYEEVCTGTTGHAEVARITFDPEVISYERLLDVFWHTHDPTTLNRQGADIGTQYRSVIFYYNDEQKRIAEESKKKTDASGLWDDPIVTEIVLFTEFFPAPDYHQDYYNNNSNKPYCSLVIAPKLSKLFKEYKDLLK
jgi:peptide-methionine (S)-S-oxide reductase